MYLIGVDACMSWWPPSVLSRANHGIQYQYNKRQFKQWWSSIIPISGNNSTNINKTKESISCDGQQLYQYQQNKRKLKQWWSTILQISGNNYINTNKTKQSLTSDGHQFYQYQATILPSIACARCNGRVIELS